MLRHYRYHRNYNKKSGRWNAFVVKEQKKYEYIPEIRKLIVSKRLADKKGMQKALPLQEGDPRLKWKHLAPVSPKATSTIVAEMVSRKRKPDGT